ncbi:dual specificity phosphatase 19 [Mactra antiquata]
MSEAGLLSQLKKFNKQSLNKTETRVRTEDGKVLIESQDSSGNYQSVVDSQKEFGFVPDYRPDLQVGEVKDNLKFGSQDVAADLETLQKYNITHVLSLGMTYHYNFPREITHVRFDVTDLPETKIFPYFEKIFDFIDEGRKAGCVYVHCNAGVSRASTFVIAYLMQKERKTFKNVFEYVKKNRPCIRPNDGFRSQLLEYEKLLNLSLEETEDDKEISYS